ncbi:Glucokinase [Planococcus massiliensis]|uniref:Glucokinase n=1 Tax=Planococcus massiliensis TaxID=1499687 RepID=A0A098EJD0_9BACL|nr:ROK family protein [Planococcus massiliensis]CEG21416.1 Glucokinase [Planococcus massiliensis]
MKIFAADIGGTKIKYCISDELGHFETFQEMDSESQNGGQAILKKVEDVIAMYSGIDAICISTAGQVDSETGCIIYANDNIPNYTGTRIKDILEGKFHVPVTVENDVNAAALGESYFGSGTIYSNFIFLTFGTGIGGGIVYDAKLNRGTNGIAGEFGHMIIHPDGISCKCGNAGCYECYASTTALIKEAEKVDPECSDGRILFEKIHNKNQRLIEVFDSWTKEVALGIVNLIHIFNPEAVIIGGGIMEQDLAVRKVSDKVHGLIIESFSDVKIVKSSLGNKAGLYGAIASRTLP